MKTIRYAIIGAGMMGQEHMRYLGLIEGCKVTAIAEPDANMRAQSKKLLEDRGQSATFYDHYHALFAKAEFDVLLIVAPNYLHYEILLEAVKLGKPIMVEKPLCINQKQCERLMTQVKANPVPIWVAMEYRYMPATKRLLERLQEGITGRNVMISIQEHRYPFLSKVGDWNRFNANTGGTMVEKSCHFFDLMRLITKSNPIRVYASAGQNVNHLDEIYEGKPSDIHDNGFVTIDFANGMRGMLDLCMFGEGEHWQEIISVTGDKGSLSAYMPAPSRFALDSEIRNAEIHYSNRQTLISSKEIIEADLLLSGLGDHHGSTLIQHQKFVDLVRNNPQAKPEVGLEEGYWAVKVGEAAELSARMGQAVSLI